MLHIIVVLLGLAQSGPIHAMETVFSLNIESPQVEYGKPIVTDLLATRLQPRLDDLDLSALEQDFVVRPLESIERDTDEGIQRWRLYLYARQTGTYQIPSIVFQDGSSEPVEVTVAPAHEGRGSAPIRVSSNVSATSGWLKQPLQWVMEIETASRYVAFEVDTPTLAGIEVTPIPQSHSTMSPEQGGRTRHRLGWLLNPQQAGHHTVQLPPAKYRRDGVITHWFYPPRLELDIKPLPSYLPATLPVGHIRLETVLPDRWYFVQGELAFLTVHISSAGRPDRTLPGILRQLKGNQDITLYPASDAEAGQDPMRDATYQLPFVPNTVGLVTLPPIRLQYFDPESGRIETSLHYPGSLLVVSQWMIVAAVAALLLFALPVLRFSYGRLDRYWCSYQAYRSALGKIRLAETAAELRAALADIAMAESWPVNLTLADWRRRWLAHYPQLSSVAEDVTMLQAQLYGQGGTSLDEMRSALLAGCYRRMPLLRLMGSL